MLSTNYILVSSADSQSSVGVPWLLPCGAKFVRLPLCKIFAFYGCCICYVCGKIYDPAKDASLGKSWCQRLIYGVKFIVWMVLIK